jgi:hypothetical protein
MVVPPVTVEISRFNAAAYPVQMLSQARFSSARRAGHPGRKCVIQLADSPHLDYS